MAGVLALLTGALACSAPEETSAPPAASPPTAPPSPATSTAVAWPTYHGAPSLDGVADLALPESLVLRWQFNAAGQVYSTPVSAQERIAFADSKGVVYVLDLDGKLVWSKSITEPGSQGRPPVPALLDAPLLIVNDLLIAGSATGVVHAWNLSDGAERWVTNTERPILGTPTFATVTVDGAPQTRIYVIDQAEGALQSLSAADGTLLWRGPGVERCDGSPAASARHVVYGSCASAVHVFSAVDGKPVRDITLDEDAQVAGGVVLLGDTIFSGSRSGKFIHANVETGALIWSNSDCDGEAFTTPAVGKDLVLFGANDANLYALKRSDGALAWKKELEDTPSSPVIARDKILISASGDLLLLRLADGQQLWSYPVSDEITSPGIAGGLIVVGGDDGTVSAFSGTNGA